MVWNGFSKVLGKDEQRKRNQVQINIPFEQPRFRMDDCSRSRRKFGADDNQHRDSITSAEPELKPEPERDVVNKSP
ncbi:MAG: hypothetical protein ACRC6S_15105 [Shewanella sp.]